MSDAPINSFNFLDELKTAVGGSVEQATITTLGTVDLQTPIIPDNITWLKVAKIPVKTKNLFDTPTSYLRGGMIMFTNTANEDKTLAANTIFATGLSLYNGLTNSCMVIRADSTIAENTLKAASSKSICFTADITFPANSTTYVFIEEDN